MGNVYITDYIENADLEAEVLGSLLASQPSELVEVLLVWHEHINAAYLDRFPSLKGVVRYGVGFDAIDLEEIRRRGLVFCNTPDYGTDEVSDTALAMLMSIVRGVNVYDYESRYFTDTWQENTLKHIRRTSEIKLGGIGAGRIGTALMRKALATGIQVMFYDPYRDSGYEKAIGVKRCYSRDELLELSDVVSIHTPLTDETSSMINESFVRAMKAGASLINTARGEIVADLDVLYDAMLDGHLYAVALDVLPSEPPVSDRLIDAWRSREAISSRILINPHTSYYSIDSYQEMRRKAAINAKRIVEGVEPINIIADGRRV